MPSHVAQFSPGAVRERGRKVHDAGVRKKWVRNASTRVFALVN